MAQPTKSPEPAPGTTPIRQIRAHYDAETITVYQAYPALIATPAVATQRLTASPSFKRGRMTWIKPSWCWMMYRAGYSHKDPGQARILALKMRHADFIALLRRGTLTHGGDGEGGCTGAVGPGEGAAA